MWSQKAKESFFFAILIKRNAEKSKIEMLYDYKTLFTCSVNKSCTQSVFSFVSWMYAGNLLLHAEIFLRSKVCLKKNTIGVRNFLQQGFKMGLRKSLREVNFTTCFGDIILFQVI